jgi:hypothetical protein
MASTAAPTATPAEANGDAATTAPAGTVTTRLADATITATAAPTATGGTTAVVVTTQSNPSAARSGSIMMQQSVTSCSHVNVCRPWISWKKGPISEYVTRPRVFFDHFHHQIVLFTGSPPSKMWLSDRRTQTWTDYPIQLPPHNDIIGAQFSPDRSHVALRVSDKEVKVLSTATGEVVTARSCRGTSSRMISVHWVHDPALAKTSQSTALFLLFVTNAGVELYELTTEKQGLLSGGNGGGITSSSTSNLTSATGSSTGGSSAGGAAPRRLKHVKTATFNIVYHWILLDENVLLLVDSRNVFQAYRLSSKQITKLCKFELDCAGTSLHPPHVVAFHREQISLVWLYGRMVILFVNEQKGQLHLLSMSSPQSSDELEQTHVFDLHAPGKYDISNIDNVLVVHNTATRVSMLFDVRSESKTTITEPLPIGPPLNNGSYMGSAGAGGAGANSQTSMNLFDVSSIVKSSSGSSAGATSSDGSKAALGMSSLAPSSFHPYVKWTFLSPAYVWESTGDQQQGNLWTLQLNFQQIAFSWPHSKRTRLVDFLLKRQGVGAKQLILQLLLQIVCTEPSSLALLSRLFSLLNRMNYDHRMNPNAPVPLPVTLANLPLLPPFSNPPSAATSAANSNVASPAGNVLVQNRAPSLSVSPYKPLSQSQQSNNLSSPTRPGASSVIGSLPSFGARMISPTAAGGIGGGLHGRTSSMGGGVGGLKASRSFDHSSPASTTSGQVSAQDTPVLSSSHPAGSSSVPLPSGLSYELDDSLSVLSCEMLDLAALQAQPLTVEQNLHGYTLISQMDIFVHVFARAQGHIPLEQLIPVVVEYLRSIHRHFLKTEDVLNDLLVSLLLQARQYFEFHQFLQYHILNDSLPIANRLISIASVYPPAYQLGIDMLYRLGQLPRLAKVLLQHQQVLAALQLVPSFRSAGFFDQWGLYPRDFLQVALNTGCELTLWQTYRFFEQRNLALRGSTGFVVGDGCEEFVHAYGERFGGRDPPPTAASLSARSSISIVRPATLATGSSAIPVEKQWLNIGDEDDSGDDDDIEYLGEKPSIFASSSTASIASSTDRDSPRSASASAAPSSNTQAENSLTDKDRSDANIPLPQPVDLSKDLGIPSASFSTSGKDGGENDDIESGLGAAPRRKERNDRAREVEPSGEMQPDVTIDGSFGGASLVQQQTEKPKESSSILDTIEARWKKAEFKAEPAM